MSKLRPCDCKDGRSVSLLQESGIGHNDDSLVVKPNFVELTIGHTTMKISMKRFKMFAEWYLEEQDMRTRPVEAFSLLNERKNDTSY